MSRLSTNVPTLRQRNQARAASNMRYGGGGQTYVSAPFALHTLGLPTGPSFARTQPGMGQSMMAARYGATGLAGPIYQSESSASPQAVRTG
ncbi:MAG TPA: hypothetical protein VMW52_10060, partial [Phycisphaerae bacterium]|nr:hypothetical protein [Phycisphaerae bacterium]